MVTNVPHIISAMIAEVLPSRRCQRKYGEFK